jgi:hypothetical protein
MRESLRRLLRKLCRDERGVSITTEVLVLVPLGVILAGFLINGAIHWMGMQYTQYLTNNASKYTAAALGDNKLSFIPGGGFDLKPSEYLSKKVSENWLTPGKPVDVNCSMISGSNIANGISRCFVAYKTLYIPTDPFSRAAFNVVIVTTAESLAEIGINPNVQ